MKVIKITAIVLGILFLIIVSLPFIFKNKIVETIKKEVTSSVNANIEFGTFDISVLKSFPDLTLTIEKLKIIGVEQFKKDTLASVGTMQITIDLMSVIGGTNYKLNAIKIDNSSFGLHVLKGGKANWDLAKTQTTATAETATSPINMRLESVVLNNCNLYYHDDDLNFYSNLKGVDQQLKGDLKGDIGDFIMNITAKQLTVDYENMRYLHNVAATVNTSLVVDLAKFRFTFENGKMGLNKLKATANGFFEMGEVDYIMDINYKVEENSFKNFLSLIPAIYAKDFESVETKGNLTFGGFVKGIYNENMIPAFGITFEIENGMIKYPSVPGSITDIFVKTNISNPDGILDNTIIDISKFNLKILDNPIEARLNLKTPESDPQYDFALKGILDLGSIAQVYPLEPGYLLQGVIKSDMSATGKLSDIEKEQYGNIVALGNFEASDIIIKSPDLPNKVNINSAMLSITPKQLDLSKLDLQIGQNDLQASGKLENYVGYFLTDTEVLTGNIAMKSKRLNMNELMPVDTAAIADTTAFAAIDIPANLNITTNAEIGKLIYDVYEMENISGMITVKDKRATLDRYTMNMLGSTMSMKGFYSSAIEGKPNVDMDFDVKNMDVQKAFTTFNTVKMIAPIASHTKGLVSANFKLKGDLGSDLTPEFSSLTGGGNLSSQMLGIESIKAFDMVADAIKLDKFRKWTLEKFNMFFEFKEGRMFVKPFPVNINNIKSEINGSTGFDKSLDYNILTSIPRSEFGAGANNVIQGLVSKAKTNGVDVSVTDVVPIALHIGGLFTSPKVSADLKQMTGSLKSDLKEGIANKKEEVVTKINEEKDKAIKAASAKADELLLQAKAQGDKLIEQAKATGDKLVAETKTQGEKLVSEAKKRGPLAEMAAKKTAEKANKEAEEKAKKMVSESQKQAAELYEKAKIK